MQQQGATDIARKPGMSAKREHIFRRKLNDTTTDLAQTVGSKCVVNMNAQRNLIAQGAQFPYALFVWWH